MTVEGLQLGGGLRAHAAEKIQEEILRCNDEKWAVPGTGTGRREKNHARRARVLTGKRGRRPRTRFADKPRGRCRSNTVPKMGTKTGGHGVSDTRKAAAAGCLLGHTAMGDQCEDCAKCGWNPKVAEARKETRRRNERQQLEILRLREARSHTLPDQDGWYSVKRALPEMMERVIVTDGVFVGEAYFGSGGWTRAGKTLPAAELGIFKPIAWMPLPLPNAAGVQQKK